MLDETNPGAPAPTPTPGPPPPAVPVPNPPPTPPSTLGSSYIQLSAEEYRALLLDRQAAETHRMEEAARAEREAQAKAKALADKEGVEAALRMMREQYETKEREHQEQAKTAKAQLLEYRKANSLNSATAGIDWASPEAAADATAKLARQFEAVEVGGEVIVRQVGTGRPASEAIPELLRTPGYQHYLRASTHGGPVMGTNRADVEIPPGWVPPQDEGQAAYATWLAQQTQMREKGYASVGLTFGPGLDLAMLGRPAFPLSTPASAPVQGKPIIQ